MYALVYPALLSGSWPEPKIFQNFDLAQTHQNIPWAGIGDSVEAIVTQQLQEPLRLQLDLILEKLEVRLFPDLMGSSLRRPTFSMHSRGLENVYFPRVECWSGPAGCSRGLNAGLVRYIDEMVHHLRRTK